MSSSDAAQDELLCRQGRLLYELQLAIDAADRAKEAEINRALEANMVDHRILCLKVSSYPEDGSTT